MEVKAIPNTDKMRSWDRILVLKKMEGEHALSTTGMVDNRLFTGSNRLHAIRDNTNCMWSLKYDAGVIPISLQQRFTSFAALMKHSREYFARRNIEIVEVID